MIRIVRGAEPQGLKTAARRRLRAAANAFNRYGAPSPALLQTQTGYGSRATKLALFRAQQEKCAWCEQETDFSSAPVEHYRPKDGAWRHLPGQPLIADTGHYWWLTWTWTNLLFSCVRCNDRGHKANYFPLLPGTAAVSVPVAPLGTSLPAPLVDHSAEEPLLLDPAGSEDPLDHIEWIPLHTSFNRRDWIWTPQGLTTRGAATILILGLEEFAERVQGHVRTRLLPSIEEVEDHLTEGRASRAHSRWSRLLDDNLAPKAEWSAFTWHALRYLVPDHYRAKHGLRVPPRPGA